MSARTSKATAVWRQPDGKPVSCLEKIKVLNQNIQRLKLDVAQHVPIHGRVGTMEEFTRIVSAPRN